LSEGVLLEKAFRAPALDEARSRAAQWLNQQKGIRLVRQNQTSSVDPGTSGNHELWTVTLYYRADGTQVFPETPADDDEAVGIV
jgi:hypothetical protein